jgi:hypothetical protein
MKRGLHNGANEADGIHCFANGSIFPPHSGHAPLTLPVRL